MTTENLSPDSATPPPDATTPSQPEPREQGLDSSRLADEIATDLGFADEAELDTGAPEAEVKDGDGEPAAQVAEGEQKPDAPAQTAATSPPPDSWRAEAKAAFATLPPIVQQEVLKREQDFMKGIGEYKTSADVGQNFARSVLPHFPKYQQAGVGIFDVTREAVDMHARLSFGTPEEKIAAVYEIADKIGLDLSALARGQPGQMNPQDRIARQRLEQIERNQAEINRQHSEAVRDRLTAEVDQFASAKGKDGELQHPFFWDVAEDIKVLISKGVVDNLADAYERAVYLNPVTRQKLEDQRFAERQTKLAREAQERATKARQTARPNKVSRETPGRTAPAAGKSSDWESELAETAREIASRS